MKKLIGLLFVLLLVAGAAAGFVYMRVSQPYRGYESAEQFVVHEHEVVGPPVAVEVADGAAVREQAVDRVRPGRPRRRLVGVPDVAHRVRECRALLRAVGDFEVRAVLKK